MNPRATRQYWEGQYDALTHWSNMLAKLADQNPTAQQIKRLASAAQIKAVLIGRNKLTKKDEHSSREITK